MSVSLIHPTRPRIVFTAADAGCYLDGHMGVYNNVRAIRLAQDHGMVLSEADEAAVSAFDADPIYCDDDLWEAVIGQGELVDKAIEYLDSISEHGLFWEWDAGELDLVDHSQDLD